MMMPPAGLLRRGDRVTVAERRYTVQAVSRFGSLIAVELIDPSTERLDAFGELTADGMVVVLDVAERLTTAPR